MSKSPDSLHEKCYLCGEKLGDDVSMDHVPMKQMYASELRKIHNPNLLTLPVHSSCNKEYQHDEDYFINSLIPFARETYGGEAIFKEKMKSFHSGKNKALTYKVLNEFEVNPSGLTLPPGKVVKRFEGNRIKRIVLKLVRGLHYFNFKEIVPAGVRANVSIFPPDQEPPDSFYIFLQDSEEKGQYPGVFDYKFARFLTFHNINYYGFFALG